MQPRHIKRIFAGKMILSFKSFRSIKGDIDFLSINMKQKREAKEMIERNVIKYKLCFMDSRNVIANRNDVMVLVRLMRLSNPEQNRIWRSRPSW